MSATAMLPQESNDPDFIHYMGCFARFGTVCAI